MTTGWGDRIRRARLDRKLTQERLAAKLAVSQVAISEWEREVAWPSKLVEACDLLELPYEAMLAYIETDDKVEAAILEQTKLTRKQRDALIEIYRGLLSGSAGDHRIRRSKPESND